MFKAVIFKRFLPLCLSLIILLGGMAVLVQAAPVETPVVSHGLSIISARTDVALSAFAGNDLVFSQEALSRGLNLSSVRYITVLSVPPAEDGELLLGSSRVVAGQTVLAEHFPNLNFHPRTEDAISTSFRFTANGSGTPLICNLRFIDKSNATPTVSMVPALSLSVDTYQNHSAYGTLSAYDSDGDELRFEIVTYPQKGFLRLTDPVTGSYVYQPNSGYTGKDSFRYVARDIYGNYSAAATVTLQVGISGTSVQYADMKDSPARNAALAMTERGIMSGSQVGNLYYFYPEKTVNRVEFLVMAMNAAGIREVPDCNKTAFADDDQIPLTMKGYVASAYQLGYITGTQKDDKLCFLPNENLTRAEAAVIIGKLLNLGQTNAIQTFADLNEIPAWARDAMLSLTAIGIMDSENGYVSPGAFITRADTAKMLTQTMKYGK